MTEQLTETPTCRNVEAQSPDTERDANLPAGGDAAEDGPQDRAQAETCTQDREGSQGADAPDLSSRTEPEGAAIELPSQEPKHPRPVELRSKADLRDLLRGAGLSRAAAEKVAAGGWPALASDSGKSDGLETLMNEIEGLESLIGQRKGKD